MGRTSVKEGWRRRGEVELGEQFVELDGTSFFMLFVKGQAHRDAHPEQLWQLEAAIVVLEEVAIIKDLQTLVSEELVALRMDGRGQFNQVILLKAWVEIALAHTKFNIV